MIIFTSDNEPWHLHLAQPNKSIRYPKEQIRAGSPGPLRGQKTETWEGGCRTPFVIKAPGLIPASSESDEIIRIVDELKSDTHFMNIVE